MADPIISQEVNIEMLEKLADGTFKIKYPKTKADLVIGLTKGHVGLGNVENYGVATQAEAEEGLVNDKYMTPLRTLELLNAKNIKIAAGSVMGGGNSAKDITVGFTPKLVISTIDHSNTMLYITTTTSFGYGYISDSFAYVSDFRIISNGFRIPPSSLTHNWVAIG